MVGKENTFFRGNETALNTIVINGCTLEPEVTVTETTTDSRRKDLHLIFHSARMHINIHLYLMEQIHSQNQ